MDPFNSWQCSNHQGVDGNYIDPVPAGGQHPHIPGLQHTQGQSQNHSVQDFLLLPQPEMQGAGYQHPQMPYKNFPVNGEGNFNHQQVPQGPSFPGVIQRNPAFGSNFYLPSPSLFFPKEDNFHPHHGILQMNQSSFISPDPFMLGSMPEYQVKSETYQGSSMMGTACEAPRTSQQEDFSLEMAHSHNPFGDRSQSNDGLSNNNFGDGGKDRLNKHNNNFGDEGECNPNFENIQKTDAKVLKSEHKSPIVQTRNHGSNMIPIEDRVLSPKDKDTTKSKKKFSHSITKANQANTIPPKHSKVKIAPKFSKPNPRSTLRKMSLSDLSTASPFKLTSPTPVTPEQLAATRMKMVFSPKLEVDTPCPGCVKHKSQMTVQCASPPAKENSEDSTIGDGTPDIVGDGLLCEKCGEFLELDPNEIINVSYLTGDNNSEEPICSDQVFDDSPLGNVGCAQTSLAGKVKKVSEAIIIVSDDDDDDVESPIGKSRRTMQFRGKISNESVTGTINKEITRPFACNVCSKTYIREHALKTHMRTHLGYSPVQLAVEPVTNGSMKKEANANLVSRNADLENNSPGFYSAKSFPFDKVQSGIGGPIIEKTSITDDEINELLISSDDEAAPPIFMPKLESTRRGYSSWNECTTKKELMENTNIQFKIKADLSEDKEDIPEARNERENLFNMKQDLNEKIVPPICRPQILKESAKHKKVHDKRVIPRTCWYCLSVVSAGPWQVNKYEPNKYLCSSCFEMHKAKAENKEKHENHLPKKVNCEGLEETNKAEGIEENVMPEQGVE